MVILTSTDPYWIGEFEGSSFMEAEENPELVRTAPHHTRTSRVDEVTAARKPVVRWLRQGQKV